MCQALSGNCKESFSLLSLFLGDSHFLPRTMVQMVINFHLWNLQGRNELCFPSLAQAWLSPLVPWLPEELKWNWAPLNPVQF